MRASSEISDYVSLPELRGVVEIVVLSRITVSIPSSMKLLTGVSRSAALAAILLLQNHHHLIDHS